MRLINLICYILCLIEIVKTVNLSTCSYYEFQCAYGGCIAITKKCDGRVDCADGSDETENCDRTLPTPINNIQPPRAPPIFPSTYGKSPSTDSKCVVPSNTFLTLIDTNTNLPLIQGSSASSMTHINYTCPSGMYLVGKETNFCLDGASWINDHPRCTKICSPIDDYTIKTVCHLYGRGVPCNKPIWPGTTAQITCEVMYQKPASSRFSLNLECQTDGNWDYELFKPFCTQHTCGIIDSTTRFSVNSQVTEVKKAPWNVGVYKKEQNEKFQHICGGTLIRSKIVISAAHCFENSKTLKKSNYIITFGKFYRDFYADEEQIIQTKTLSKIDIPSQYDPSNDFSYDIAVLTLNDHIKFNNYIRPACLTWRNGNDQHMPSGKIGNVAGWGRTNDGNFSPKLRSVDLETVDLLKCREEKIRPTDNLAFDKFCVETAEGKNVCEGDSGSGLLISQRHGGTDYYYLWGIVSNGIIAGSLNCNSNFITSFTNIQYYKNLIENAINNAYY